MIKIRFDGGEWVEAKPVGAEVAESGQAGGYGVSLVLDIGDKRHRVCIPIADFGKGGDGLWEISKEIVDVPNEV